MSLARFGRMIAIPEEEYLQLKSLQEVNNPLQNKFLSLSNEYHKQSSISDPYVRVQRQGETLNQMINLKDELKRRLLEVTPKPYQSRAQSLFQFVANKLNLNEKGELLNADGSVLSGSNIGDLIQHSVRDRRRNIVPTGWQTFLDVLRDNNVPRMILNYDTLDEMKSPSSTSTPLKKTPVTVIKKENNWFLDKNLPDMSAKSTSYMPLPSKAVKKKSSPSKAVKKKKAVTPPTPRKSSRTKKAKVYFSDEYSSKSPSPTKRKKYF